MTSSDPRPTFDAGLRVRKEVLGESYVNKSLADANEFSMPMQELSTEWCWGTVWARPGLPRRIRSLINIAMLSALNRPNEFKIHVQAALNNGVSRDEIQEVLLQVAVYCGVPAGLEGFRLARDVFDIVDSQPMVPVSAPKTAES